VTGFKMPRGAPKRSAIVIGAKRGGKGYSSCSLVLWLRTRAARNI
jgi:hypothetical protein